MLGNSVVKILFIFFIKIILLNAAHANIYTYYDCQAIEKESLREEMDTFCRTVFSQKAEQNIFIDRIIQHQWYQIGIDQVIDNEVEKAVVRVKKNHGYFSRLSSGWSSEKARAMTEEVASMAFGSEAFRRKIKELSDGIAKELSSSIETVTAATASTALSCLQEFVGDKYSKTVFSVFENEITKKTDAFSPETPDIGYSVLGQRKMAISGLGVIIATQISKRITKRIVAKISRRILGRIAGRVAARGASTFVPIVGWIVGGGMIAYDLFSGSDGALPEIEKGLKDHKVKSGIKETISIEVRQAMVSESRPIARAIVNEIYSQWTDFTKKFRDVLNIAENNLDFKAIIDNTLPTDFYKLAKLTEITKHKAGMAQFEESIYDGSFEEALSLPEVSFAIIEGTNSLKKLIDWSNLSGSYIQKVVEYEIYKLRDPHHFDKQNLENLFGIQNGEVIKKIVQLSRNSMENMLNLSTRNLVLIVTNLNIEEVDAFAWYLDYLDQEGKNFVAQQIASNPSDIKKLQNEKIKSQITESGAPNEIINYALMPDEFGSVMEGLKRMLTQKEISIGLFWHKFAGKSIVLFFGIFLTLGLVLGLTFRKIPKTFLQRKKD